MRLVVQRVRRARVSAQGAVSGQIGRGILLLLGIAEEDGEREIAALVDKVVNLRIFEDREGRMNRSLLEVGGELLVVSQFTLYGDARKGRRPSYNRAAAPDHARELYRRFLEIAGRQLPVAQGSFGDHMEIDADLDGPVTILIDSEKQF